MCFRMVNFENRMERNSLKFIDRNIKLKISKFNGRNDSDSLNISKKETKENLTSASKNIFLLDKD